MAERVGSGTVIEGDRFDTHRIDRLVAGSPEDCIAAIEKFR